MSLPSQVLFSDAGEPGEGEHKVRAWPTRLDDCAGAMHHGCSHGHAYCLLTASRLDAPGESLGPLHAAVMLVLPLVCMRLWAGR